MAELIGAMLVTYVLTRAVIRVARKRTSDGKAPLLAFLIVATLALLITRFTMHANEGYRTYMPCLLFWLAFDMVRLKVRPKKEGGRERTPGE